MGSTPRRRSATPVVGPVVVLVLAVVLLGACGGTSRPVADPSGSVAASDEHGTADAREARPPRSATARPDPAPATAPDPAPEPEEQLRMDTALIEAAWSNDVRRARELVRAGADVNHQDDTQQSAFLIAASEGHLELLDLTLRHGADVADLDSFRGTALIRAAERGHDAIVGRLLQAGVARDHVNELGWTALHEAVILGEGTDAALRTVRVLVAGGVDVGIPTVRDGLTAGEHADSLGYDAIAGLLRAAEGAPGPADADEALLAAARAGDADAAALALRGGARLEARDERRRTPLLLAVTQDHLDVARLLVHLGADPDAVDDRSDTPWLVTGVTGSVTMAHLLLTEATPRPDLTLRNRYGGVSVIPASERGHVDYVRRVVRTDMDLDHVNDLGWTALLEAVILGEGSEPWQQVVAILLDHGADPTIADRHGVTPLEHARQRGYDELARLLARA